MGYWEGLLGGFVNRKYEVEDRNRRQSQQDSERERAIFSALMNADDPETRSLALAGMLDSANPRRKAKGLRGWIGETQASPYLAQIRDLQKIPVTETQTETRATLPSQQMSGGMAMPSVQPSITEPPPEPSAGMPPSSPVQPGGAPPTPVRYTQAPPTPYSLQRTVQRPREAFLSPIKKYELEQVAKNESEITGMTAGLIKGGFAPDEAKALIKEHLSRQYGGVGQSYAEGEITPDPTSPTGYSQLLYLRSDPTKQQRIPAMPKTALSSRAVNAQEQLAHALFGQPKEDPRSVMSRLSPPEMSTLLEASKLQKSELTVKDAIAAAQRFLPNATIDQQMALADALKSGTAAPITAGGPPAPTGTPIQATPATTTPATGTPTVGAPPTPTGMTAPKQGLSGVVPPELGAGSKESGKPMPPAVARTLAQAKSTNDLIDQAMKALEPFKDDTSLQGSMDLVSKYRQGVYDPVNGAAAQLADLAGLQASAQSQLTGGGTRAFQFYVDRRQHVPKLPSIRQVQANSILPAGAVQAVSGMLKDDAGTFDSPQQMYEKLARAKANNENFVKELEAATRTNLNPIAPVSSHAPTAPGTAYKDAAGVWHIRQ